MSIASIHDLTVKYGSFEALKDFTVDVPEGAVGPSRPERCRKDDPHQDNPRIL